MTPALLLLQSLFFANPAEAQAAHAAEVEDWFSRRVARLTEPYGWLSLVGLHWLEGNAWRLGSAPDNDVVLSVGPKHLGVLRRGADDSFLLVLADGVDAGIGDAGLKSATLSSGDNAAPVEVHVGDARIVLLDRGHGRYALRVRDPQAPSRTGFAGIERYPVQYDWRFDARWQQHETPRGIEIVDVTGAVNTMRSPGSVEFEVDGRSFTLDAVQEEGDTQLWLILADRTSGRDTYGAGRFLYTPLPDEAGRVVVDFNRAYNPPCAFTEYSTCPLPPPQNRLDLPVTAGEKRYRHEAKPRD